MFNLTALISQCKSKREITGAILQNSERPIALRFLTG